MQVLRKFKIKIISNLCFAEYNRILLFLGYNLRILEQTFHFFEFSSQYPKIGKMKLIERESYLQISRQNLKHYPVTAILGEGKQP